MSDKEVNLPDYISFVYNRFLMTRVEYLIFTQSEQESKVLRIIEWCIENERVHLYRAKKARVAPGEKVELPEIIWVAISHRFFMDQLQGTVQSETTLKDVLASLEAKHFIFRGPCGPGPYDAPIYTINKHLLAALSSLLPPTLDDLDMIAIMKKEREVKKVREGQKLTPSKIDPLVEKIRETIIAPLDPQLLTLYSPKIDPLLRSRGGQKLTPRIYKETTKEESKKSNMSSSDDAPSHQSEKERELEKEVDGLKAQIAQLLQAFKDSNYPPEPPKGGASPTTAGQNDTSLTPAGRTIEIGENHVTNSTLPADLAYRASNTADIPTHQEETIESGLLPTKRAIPDSTLHRDLSSRSHTYQDGVSEPLISATDGLVQESPAMPRSETTPSESQHSATESPSTTEQKQQGNGVSDSQSTTKKSGKSTGGKGKGKSKKKDVEPVEPVPPPTRPDSEMPYGVEKILAWGDYFRGYPLPESTAGTSRYVKARKAAERWIRRNLTEKRFVTILRFMRGVKITLEKDEEFRAKWWPEHCPADVWHVEEQCDAMVLEINQLRALKSGQPIDFSSRRAEVEAAAATRQPTNSLPPIPEGWTPPSKKVSGGMQSWQ